MVRGVVLFPEAGSGQGTRAVRGEDSDSCSVLFGSHGGPALRSGRFQALGRERRAEKRPWIYVEGPVPDTSGRVYT